MKYLKTLTLANGQTAKFLYEDDWSRPVYELESGVKACCVRGLGNFLHTVTPLGEPECPLKDEYQPVTDT